MNKALLPAGFHDLLFPEAGAQADIVAKLSKYFQDFGYFLVSPPVIEFEESLFAGAGKALENSTFRLMDPLSHNMMGVRADITVQVARMATSRLANEPMPLRLAYAGDVFRVKGEGLYAERQFTQAGIELIGVNSANADAEVVVLALEALKNIGIGNLCIDFTVPGLVEIILHDFKGDKDALLAAIRKKDNKSIEKFGGKLAKLLTQLVDPAIDAGELAKLKLPKEAATLCNRVSEVITIVKERLKNVHVSLDPIAAANFSYHSGIGFSVFSKNAKGELARGGRYIIDDKIEGIGITLYVNELFRILPKPEQKDKVFVPLGTPAKQVEKLIADGLVAINALEKHKDDKKEAKRLKCQFVWDGKLVKL
jgi:ATP phosphoribosyltransferase regulatory subunit